MRGGRKHRLWGIIGVLDEEGNLVEKYQLDNNERLKSKLKRQKRRKLAQWLRGVLQNEVQQSTTPKPATSSENITEETEASVPTDSDINSSAPDVLDHSGEIGLDVSDPTFFTRDQLANIDWLLNSNQQPQKDE